MRLTGGAAGEQVRGGRTVDVNIAEIAALAQVVLIDLTLAGDSAIAVGLAAAALPRSQQRRAIIWGIVLALVLRITLSLMAIASFQNVPYLMLAGGVLLFWVVWRMWRDVQAHRPVSVGVPVADEHMAEAIASGAKTQTTFGRALLAIVVADVSKSLDNVLAVAAVSLEHPFIMAFGLVLSVILMGIAASIIARFLERFRWIAMIGIVVILFAGVRMIWEGGRRDFPHLVPAMPTLTLGD